MPARFIEYMPLSQVQRAARNPKRHDQAVLEASMARHGFVESPTIDERTGRLVAGHGRIDRLELDRAAGKPPPDGVEVGEDGEWLVPVARGWSSRDDADAAAYLLTSNQATIGPGWELPELAPMLEELFDTPLGLDGTGFDREALDEMLAGLAGGQVEPTAHSDPDLVPPAPTAPVTQRGDRWLLGPHRLVCGDATATALPECDALVSDPPYGMGLNTGWYGSTKVGSKFADLGAVKWDAEPFDPRRYASAAPTVALFGANYFPTLLPERGTWWVWDKRTTSDGEGTIDFNGGMPYEFIWMNGQRAHRMIRYLWSGYYRQAGTPATERHNDHPTQKPVAVMAEVIEYLTKPGETILDPFGGSGSTLIAADVTGRVAHLIELDPGYCDVTLARFERHTGIVPVLESTGEPHTFHHP